MKINIFAQISAAQRAREQNERRDRTVARNIASGRCGVCLKKPFDCRCAKQG